MKITKEEFILLTCPKCHNHFRDSLISRLADDGCVWFECNNGDWIFRSDIVRQVYKIRNNRNKNNQQKKEEETMSNQASTTAPTPAKERKSKGVVKSTASALVDNVVEGTKTAISTKAAESLTNKILEVSGVPLPKALDNEHGRAGAALVVTSMVSGLASQFPDKFPKADAVVRGCDRAQRGIAFKESEVLMGWALSLAETFAGFDK